MVQVALYKTTGTYPNLTKGASAYIFYPEPTFTWNFRKNNDYEEIPYLAVPICYDPYTQDRKITVKGTFVATVAADPPGAKTLIQRFEDLDKLSFFLAAFADQPEASNATEVVYVLEITFPDTTVKQHFVAIEGLNASWAGGHKHIPFTLTLKEIESVILT